MLIRETARTAWRSLTSHPLRSLLTALGMIIGVMAVISVLSIGEGAKASVENRIRALGSNLLSVRPARNRGGPVVNGSAPTLIRSDADAIEEIDGVSAVSAETAGSAQVKFRENNMSATIYGITPSYLGIRNLDVAQGIGFSDNDDADRRRFASAR